jgi:hypothetical protein
LMFADMIEAHCAIPQAVEQVGWIRKHYLKV